MLVIYQTIGSLSIDDEWDDDDDRKSVRDTFKELRMPDFHKPSSCSRRRRNLQCEGVQPKT